MPTFFLRLNLFSLSLMTMALQVVVPGLSLKAFDSPKFHLHQEGRGNWVLEAPHFDLTRSETITENRDQPGALVVQRIPEPSETNSTPVAIRGSWVMESGRLLFRPKFPFREGLRFHVIELTSSGKPEILFTFRIPLATSQKPEIISIEPDSEVWPENLLRVYIHFSRPMSRGEANHRITIQDAHGQELVQPFLQLDQELWDRDGKRLTLLFDPGRVKKGLKPREEDGAILENGKSYTLKVSAGWPDSRGIRTENSFEKRINVGPADSQPIDPRKWKIKAPIASAESILEIRFDGSVDTGMALRMIQVLESGECPVDGRMEIASDGRGLKFKPDVKWSPGLHFIEVNPTLEDPSGNQVGRPFERNIETDKNSLMKDAKPVRLTFIVKMTE